MADSAITPEDRRKRQREYQRQYRERNRERLRAQANARYAANREHIRQLAAEYRDKNRYRIANQRRKWAETQRHGRGFNAWRQAAWDAQDGKCYLCQRELGPDLRAIVEHDHRCCPNNKTCETCRRGLACDRCNNVISLVDDDPEVLELIARNLRPVMDAVTARLAARTA